MAKSTLERVPPNSYRTPDGRFTISKVHRGRCYGDVWILVDNRKKQKLPSRSLKACRSEIDEILREESTMSDTTHTH